MAAEEITVSVTNSTWAASHPADVEFNSDQVSVVNMSAVPADVVQVSFNKGQSVAATLTPGSAQAGYTFECSGNKIWLRRTVVGAAVECRVVFTKKV